MGVLDLGAVASRSYQTDAVHIIAHPNLRIVVAHLGQPNPMVETDRPRQVKNVWLDNAALPAYLSNEGYPYPGAARYIRIAIGRIGPNK